MADTGPCGPSSEIFWDLGPEHGPDGGPSPTAIATSRSGISCSCSSTSGPTARASRCPKPSIDTGAGLERNLMVAQDAETIWDIDVFRPLHRRGRAGDGRHATARSPATRSDVSLRIIAEHARTMTFMVSDGVRPSNQERGYVLRRIIRRAVRHAYLLGARDLVTPALVDATVDVMGNAYPEIVTNHDVISKVIEREEEAFRAHAAARRRPARRDRRARATSAARTRSSCTTRSASRSTSRVEIAAERGRAVDSDGFDDRDGGATRHARAPRPTSRRRMRRTASSTASSSTSTDRPSSPGATNTRRTRPSLALSRRRARRQAEMARRRRRARPHAVLRRVRRPDRRHRHDHDRGGANSR